MMVIVLIILIFPRSRPIISVFASFNVSKEEIDLDVANCSVNDDKIFYSCFSLNYCFK